MKKLLLVTVSSLLLVSCGAEKEPAPVVVVETSTTTTSTTLPVVVEETTTTSTATVNVPTTVRRPTPTTVQPPKVQPKASAGAIGNISIPSIGVNWPIYEGIALSVLNKGPGHYPHSPKPCRAGNAAIAGHRTTYGAPFNKLDVLKDGDVVNITTPEGDCTYKYLRTEIVSPNNIDVVMPKGGNMLTLTACHPKGSARQRITVTFSLDHVVVK